jgi:hypothetical protein
LGFEHSEPFGQRLMNQPMGIAAPLKPLRRGKLIFRPTNVATLSLLCVYMSESIREQEVYPALVVSRQRPSRLAHDFAFDVETLSKCTH